MSKIHQNDLAIGTKVYSFSVDTRNSRLRRKEGEIVYHPCGVDKMVQYDKHDKSYLYHRNDYSLVVDEYDKGRVLLLEDNPKRAMELIIEHEVHKIALLYDEIEERKDNLDKLRDIEFTLYR